MAIKVKINPSMNDGKVDVEVKDKIKVKIVDNSSYIHNFQLKINETLDGNFLIFDHTQIDITVLKEQKKIVTFAKDTLTDSVYGAQTRLFEFLKKKGIVGYDTIQGGNVYGSLEGKILDSSKYDPFESALLNIAEWVKEEAPHMEAIEAYDEMMDDYFTEPTPEDSTRLGKVPQSAKKGSIQPEIFGDFLYGRYSF